MPQATGTKHCWDAHGTTASRDAFVADGTRRRIPVCASLRFNMSGFLPVDVANLPQNVTPNLEQFSSKAEVMCGEVFFCRRLFYQHLSEKTHILKAASLKVAKAFVDSFLHLLNANIQPNKDRDTILSKLSKRSI